MTDWAAIYFELSKEFGWTPETIRRLTIQELVHYLERLHEYRDNILPADLVLEQIKQAFFAFMGVTQDKPGADSMDEQIKKSGFPTVKVTKEAMDAWEKAGRPNPHKFFSRWKKGRNNG